MKTFSLIALFTLFLLPLSIRLGAQVNLTNGLMAYYSFAGNANDVSGNGNNGTTAGGVTLRPDRANTPNECYEFDGINDNIQVPNSTSFNATTNRQSISFWFQLCFIPPMGDPHEYYIMSKMDGPNVNGWHIFMRWDTDNVLRMYYRGVNGGNFTTQNICTVPLTNVELGSWHHVVYVIGANNGNNNAAIHNTIYVDYVTKSSAVAQNTVPFVIGGGINVWSTNDAYFGLGRLDEIRYYNRAINDQEVAALYNQIPITSFNLPITLAENNGLCLANDSLILTASTVPGLSYEWTQPSGGVYTGNPLIIENPTAADAGTYTVVPSYDGCQRPPVTITVAQPLPQLALTGPTQACTNSPFTFSVANNPNATYSWQYPNNGTVAGNSLSWPTAALADQGDYYLSYMLNGCIGYSDTVTMAVVQQYTLTVYDTICQGQSVLLAGAQQTTAGSYQDMYQSNTGCDSLVTTELFVKPLPQVSLGADQQSCVGSTVTLSATTDGTVTIWSTNETTPNIDVTTTNAYWFEAVLDGCTARDTINVTFYLNPASNFVANNSAQCLTGNNFDFNPNNTFAAGTIFDWAFTGALTPTSNANNPTGIIWDAAGSYPVSLVVTENGCVSQPAQLTVTVFPQPSADFIALPTQGCEPVDVKFNNTTQSGVLYNSNWVLGDGSNSVDQSPVHIYANDGNYSVTLTVTDVNGCTDTETKTNFITVFPQPVAGFSLAQDVLATTSPVLTVTSEALQASNCVYYLNDGTAWSDCSFTDNIQGSGLFTITQVVTSGAGCIDSTSSTFSVKPTPEVFIPNTFTPNGDYINERFEPSISWIGEYSIIIYDRWGGIVFETDDLFTYWNGKMYNYGTELPQGIYAYKIRYRPFQLDKDFYVTGSVSLIR